jgi:hypothetical protein
VRIVRLALSALVSAGLIVWAGYLAEPQAQRVIAPIVTFYVAGYHVVVG